MALQHAGRHCKKCGEQVLAQRPGTNHILHLLLTIFTAGFWLIVWILASVKIGGWRCTRCGRSV